MWNHLCVRLSSPFTWQHRELCPVAVIQITLLFLRLSAQLVVRIYLSRRLLGPSFNNIDSLEIFTSLGVLVNPSPAHKRYAEIVCRHPTAYDTHNVLVLH